MLEVEVPIAAGEVLHTLMVEAVTVMVMAPVHDDSVYHMSCAENDLLDHIPVSRFSFQLYSQNAYRIRVGKVDSVR